MKVPYSYKIINVDNNAKTMEIVYTSEKYGDLHVSSRLPWSNETVEEIVKLYNPSLYWAQKETQTLSVEVGLEGTQEVDILDFENSENMINSTDVQNITNSKISKFRALYALAAFGLLHKVDKIIRLKGSLQLKKIWSSNSNIISGSWIVRNCPEVYEAQKLGGLSDALVDSMFELASSINVQNPKENLSETQKKTFEVELRIWTLKELLADTDYMELPSYDKPNEEMILQRVKWRNEIRELAQSSIK